MSAVAAKSRATSSTALRSAALRSLAIAEIGLFLDADGTLLDLQPRPDDVVAAPGLVATLETAWRALDGALAVVSGRRIENLDHIFSPLLLPSNWNK